MDRLSTSIEIDAPADTVWAVLVDFEGYPEWHPRMRITGRAEEGTRLTVAPGPEAGRVPTFRPVVVRVDPGRELRWLGHLLVRGLFDGEHRFEIEPLDDDRSRLVQSERFAGLLVRPITALVGRETERGFRATNEALKARAESMAAAGAGEAVETGEPSEPAT